MRCAFRCLVVLLGVMLASALAAAQPDGSGERESRSFSTASVTRAFEFRVHVVPSGIDADMVQAIGRVLGREVQLKLTTWGEAQRLVSEGAGDAPMARTLELRKVI